MKMNDIGLGQGGAEGAIGYAARKINESIDNPVTGMKIALETYETIAEAKDRPNDNQLNRPIIPKEEKPAIATTSGFFDGPGLTDLPPESLEPDKKDEEER